MDLVQSLSWVDLAVILVLAVGVFAGFTQGTIVYVLNSLALLVAFIVAAQLKGPLIDLLGFWTAFAPEGKDLIVFMLLFIGLTVAAWFVIFAGLPAVAAANPEADRRDRWRDPRTCLRRAVHQRSSWSFSTASSSRAARARAG